MKKQIDELLKVNSDIKRANASDYISRIFGDFIQLSGDRLYGEDSSILGGISTFNGKAITVIAQMRGKNTEENIKYNYSMSNPEGFRKSLRLMKQAEKFRRPIICFIDTLGAHPGEDAEKRGQASAISHNLMEMMFIKVPIISILIGNGGSGGALALCVANEIAMLENALFSVINPKGCANILWKDSSKEIEAARILKMTSYDLYEHSIIDEIIPEKSIDITANNMKIYLENIIRKYQNIRPAKIINLRYKKFRKIGISSQVNEIK